jgi:hypothetical protein
MIQIIEIKFHMIVCFKAGTRDTQRKIGEEVAWEKPKNEQEDYETRYLVSRRQESLV